MEYRKLGRTGLEVSALSFGASSLGGVFHDTDDRTSIQTVHEAVDLGINLIDVSPYYGLTRAETVLGKAIAELPRDRFILSTKAGRYGLDEFDFSAKRIVSSLDESLQRLRTDYVDILYLHDIEFVPFEQFAESAFNTLEQLKQSGKIRYYGVSALPLAALEKAASYTSLDVVLSYCHYSLNDNRLLEYIPLLKRLGVGVINASPMSMGLLTGRSVPDWHLASEEIKRVCRQAADYCMQRGADLAKLAVQYSTSEKQIATTLVSTASPANIRKNVEWMNEPLDEQLLQEVLAILEPIHNKTWDSGLPEYN